MCGIAGVFTRTGVGQAAVSVVRRMNDLQKHRGPDDEGLYKDPYCVFGHRRLSIIDLSKDGHQPFFSDDSRYIMVCNGEIYNYIELRDELIEHGISFGTATDSEVLLKAYLHYGPACLSRFNGMFAFAVYDSLEKSLFLARDRFGVKPLYYTQTNGTFYFASEIKALRQTVGQTYTVNEQALFEYLCFNRTDIGEETFLNQIKRLHKGCYAIYGESLKIQQWWDPETFLANPVADSVEEICRTTEELLVSSVALRMRSDVTVGSCLSGGLDSSILAGIVYQHKHASGDYLTFTAAFPGYALDETRYVEALNLRYPFKNYQTYPSANNAYENLRRFVYANDEPLTGPSFYSQYEVMRLAHEHNVTVLLDGQGGDESFAGYQYLHGFRFNELFRTGRYGKLAAEMLQSIIRGQEKEGFQTFLFQVFPPSLRKTLLLRTLPHIKKSFFSQHVDHSVIYQRFFSAPDLNASLARHFLYKFEHLLRPEDRNAMAFSIEARMPYLDYRLVEYLLRVPGSLKLKKGETKMLQKRALGKYSIPQIVERRDKIGFGTPGNQWMRDERWQKLTETNYRVLCDRFPHIFNDRVQLKHNLYDRWKINQIATWLEVFNN